MVPRATAGNARQLKLGKNENKLSFSGCAKPDWVGDGYCDYGNNNELCNYDGRDCCGDCWECADC